MMEINGKRIPFLNEARRQTAVALGKKDMGFANGGRAKPTTKMNYVKAAKPVTSSKGR